MEASGGAHTLSNGISSGFTLDLQSCYNDWCHTWYPPSYTYTNYFYPTYDRGEKAFKILEKLIEQKLIKVTTVPEFIKAMNTLISLL